MIVCKQMTVCWNVNDLKVSHMDPNEVINFMKWLEKIYGKLRITRGKVHKYIVMMLDLRTPVEMWITMVDYLKGVLEDLPEVITGRITILAANHIFQVRPED